MTTTDVSLEINNSIISDFANTAQPIYSPILRDTFYALVPSQFKYYYLNTIREPLYWYQGFNPRVHKQGAGIFPTGIGNSIVHEIMKLVVGGQVFFENKYAEKSNKKKTNQTLIEFNKWSDRTAFQNIIKKYIEYAAAGGTAVLVAYINDNNDIVYKPQRIDQFFYDMDICGHVIAYTGFLGVYTPKLSSGDGRSERDINYYILEKRFYNDDLKPVMRFAVHYQQGNVMAGEQFDITKTTEVTWDRLPKFIRNILRREFPGIRFGEDNPINFTNKLGVYPLLWTVNNRIPEIGLGESVLLNVLGYLMEWEMEESHFVTDMYISKGKVLVPSLMNPTDKYNGYYSGFDGITFKKMPMQNLDDQKPMALQFDMRSEEHKNNRNNIAEKMASTIGVSGSELFSFLRDAAGGSKTATQIAAEAQKTISYIEEKRSIIIESLTPVIKTWKEFYKQQDDIRVRFSSQNMVNKMVSIDEMRMLKEIGFPLFDLYRKVSPDLDDDQINEIIDRHYEDQEKAAKISAIAKPTSERSSGGKQVGQGLKEKEEKEETKKEEENEIKETGEGQSIDLK